jgi:putative DNA primase/helicase
VTRPAILARLRGVQQSGDGWTAFCPSHADREKRSLSVKLAEDGRTLLHCFVGCETEKVCRAVSMTLADLAPPPSNGRRPSRREIAAYANHDERGALLYEVVRFEPKDFRPRRPDGQGGWAWDLKGVRRVVYRLPELAEQRRVVLVEGEKDADRLWALGIPATTTQGARKSWRDQYAEQIRAAGNEEVVPCPDNDDAGRAYVQAAGAALTRLQGSRFAFLTCRGYPRRATSPTGSTPGARAMTSWHSQIRPRRLRPSASKRRPG